VKSKKILLCLVGEADGVPAHADQRVRPGAARARRAPSLRSTSSALT
jgi:hypothetical protein